MRPTYGARQEVLFALPNSLGDLKTQDVRVWNRAGNSVAGIQIAVASFDGEPSVRVTNPESLKPGSYTLEVNKNGKRVFTQDFSWGVLALNYAKSSYAVGERVQIDMGVLDENGGMVCDAQISLRVTEPSGRSTTLSTSNGKVTTNPECEIKAYVGKPDYETYFYVEEEGDYQLSLHAKTKNGGYEIRDYQIVDNDAPFVVERAAHTRIYPPANYPVTLRVTAREDLRQAGYLNFGQWSPFA